MAYEKQIGIEVKSLGSSHKKGKKKLTALKNGMR